jgi:hypothetical protein
MDLLLREALNGKQPTTGRDFARKLREASPANRAIQALALVDGFTIVTNHTYAQAARLAETSVDSISIVAHATPVEIEYLKRGWLSLRDVRWAHANRPNRPTAADIEAFIDRVGPDAVWNVFDRLTAPANLAAE